MWRATRKYVTKLAGAVLGVAVGLGSAACVATAAAGDEAPEKLLVFVGQKIDLTEQKTHPCDNCIVMDLHYLATYRILDTVYGNYRGDTIRFDVHDHYGTPAFSKYETVLLYLRRQPDGSWVHEKYQFNDLYRGLDGQWYGCGDPYGATPNPPRTVRARPVEFPAPVSYPLEDMSPERIARSYPAPYFEIRGGRAYCLQGAPVHDLFEAKKQTVLKARGLFQ